MTVRLKPKPLFLIRYCFRSPYGRRCRASTVWRGEDPRRALDDFIRRNPHVLSCHAQPEPLNVS
jgi:hypothetical protein